MKKYRRAILDFTKVDSNLTVQAQGRLYCILITAYGAGAWFSPELGRYPSRQDLAEIDEIEAAEI
ncbi:MAG: hypothetical protein ACXWTR_05360 [Methylotenera sp.]